jgi:hypothetical protein
MRSLALAEVVASHCRGLGSILATLCVICSGKVPLGHFSLSTFSVPRFPDLLIYNLSN